MRPDSESVRRTFTTDSRAVSITVTHALSLGITGILITALMIGAGTLLDDQQERIAHEELQDLGGKLAQEIQYVDSLDDETVEGAEATVTARLPESVAGMQYTVNVRALDYAGDSDKEAMLYLNTTTAPFVSVTVPVSNETWIDTSSGVKTDEFRLRLCHGTGSPYSGDDQLIVLGRECP